MASPLTVQFTHWRSKICPEKITNCHTYEMNLAPGLNTNPQNVVTGLSHGRYLQTARDLTDFLYTWTSLLF